MNVTQKYYEKLLFLIVLAKKPRIQFCDKSSGLGNIISFTKNCPQSCKRFKIFIYKNSGFCKVYAKIYANFSIYIKVMYNKFVHNLF